MKRATSLTLLALPSFTLACSGLHVRETIQAAQHSAFMGAAACALLTLFAAVLRLRAAIPVCLVLLAVHPAWTISPNHGDCGGTQETATLLVALLSLGVFAWDLLRRSRWRP